MIKNSSLAIRLGTQKDFSLYEKWHNTSLSFPKIIKGEEPQEDSISSQFKKLLAPDLYLKSKFYVIEGTLKDPQKGQPSESIPIAQVHLELLSSSRTDTSSSTDPTPTYSFYLSLDPDFQKQGLGKRVIRLAAKFLTKEKKIPKLLAEIHRRNTFAILCFSKAKFQFVQTTTHQGAYCQEYQYLL